MQCKFCKAEMEADRKYCPVCGKRQDIEKKQEKQTSKNKQKPKTPLWQIIAAIALSVILVGLLVYLFVKDAKDKPGNKNNPQASETASAPTQSAPIEEPQSEYSAYTDVKAGEALGVSLSNGLLQMYFTSEINTFYEEYSAMMSYFGLDITKPLDEQTFAYDETGETPTWEDYFLDLAVEQWSNQLALCKLADASGFVLDEEWIKAVDEQIASLDEMATKNNYVSANAMIKMFYGDCCSVDIYREYLMQDAKATAFYNTLMQVTDEQIAAAYEKNMEKLNKEGITKDSALVSNVRHILIVPEGGTLGEDGKTTVYSEAEWEACKTKAETVYNEWKNGAKTEDTFKTLVTKYSQDSGSVETGGLYQYVANDGTYVEAFQNWAIDTARVTGDSGLVRTEFGYHIMYFVSGEPEWIYYSRLMAQDEQLQPIEKMLEESPVKLQKDDLAVQNIYTRAY